MHLLAQPTRLQAGTIPYRWPGDGGRAGPLQVLLVTARNSRRWLVPKGNIESTLTPIESAAREAWEEAGVLGDVHQHVIGTYRYSKRGIARVVRLYPMAVHEQFDHWPEMHERKRVWLSIDEAYQYVFTNELALALHRLHDMLQPAIAAA